MNSLDFLQVVHATAVDPLNVGKALLPRVPPSPQDLAKLPPVPLQEEVVRVRYTLCVRVGRGGPKDFQTAPNPSGTDETVCRQWRFENGLFLNDEPFGWPTNYIGPYHDLMIYDPNWPWNRLMLTAGATDTFIRLLLNPKAGTLVDKRTESFMQVLALKLKRMTAHQNGSLFWYPGDFVIPLASLSQDLVDVRSETAKHYAERFERQRRARAARQETDAEKGVYIPAPEAPALLPWMRGLLTEG